MKSKIIILLMSLLLFTSSLFAQKDTMSIDLTVKTTPAIIKVSSDASQNNEAIQQMLENNKSLYEAFTISIDSLNSTLKENSKLYIKSKKELLKEYNIDLKHVTSINIIALSIALIFFIIVYIMSIQSKSKEYSIRKTKGVIDFGELNSLSAALTAGFIFYMIIQLTLNYNYFLFKLINSYF